MINKDDLTAIVAALLGKVPVRFSPEKLASYLNSAEEKFLVGLSPYGYVLYLIDKHGTAATWNNILVSEVSVNGYASEAVRIRDDFPVFLLNADLYFRRLAGSIPDLKTCLDKLSGMSFPHVLYVLFAGTGQQELAEQYRSGAEEIAKRYPSAFELLPGKFKQVGEELVLK